MSYNMIQKHIIIENEEEDEEDEEEDDEEEDEKEDEERGQFIEVRRQTRGVRIYVYIYICKRNRGQLKRN